MPKSIRGSVGICEPAASAGDAANRLLADQVEYGARLGAAFDAAGVTMEPVMEIPDAAASVISLMTDLTDATAGTRRRRPYSGAPTIAARNAQLAHEVMTGVRTPESLFMLSREQVQSAKFVERMPTAPGQGW